MNPRVEYRRVLSDVQRIAERLPEAVNAHAARQEATPHYWSHVSDLKKVRIDLLHVLAFLGDLEARETLLAEGQDR